MITASILTVGTEITTGEILNRNAAWIAARLEEMAISVRSHVSVPDDWKSILNGLELLIADHRLIFVTGGLGPTSDDFTRNVVAQFVGHPLVFSETSWKKLKTLYADRGLPLREAHRKQCHFPENAEIMNNLVGTAEGFLIQISDKMIFVLPGPPREVEGIFNAEILPRLQGLAVERVTELTKLVCLGVPESEVAEVVEETLKGREVTLGYRASFPYVYVKVWHPVGQTEWLSELKERLGGWVVGDGDVDLMREWMRTLQGLQTVRIVDEATGGRLGVRLESMSRQMDMSRLELEMITYWGPGQEYARDTNREHVDAVFSVHSSGDSKQFRVTANLGGHAISRVLELPFKINSSTERGRSYMAEHAIYIWLKFMRQGDKGQGIPKP